MRAAVHIYDTSSGVAYIQCTIATRNHGHPSVFGAKMAAFLQKFKGSAPELPIQLILALSRAPTKLNLVMCDPEDEEPGTRVRYRVYYDERNQTCKISVEGIVPGIPLNFNDMHVTPAQLAEAYAW